MKLFKLAALASATLSAVTLSPAANAQALLDDFSGTGGPDSSLWTVSTQTNGSPFGCGFSTSEVWKSGGNLVMNVNPNTKKCSEIKSIKKFTYGKYLIRMTPSTFAGGNSTFFLYTGTTGGAPDHYEIDIEFINGGKTLHTNYFIKGGDNKGDNFKQFPAPTGTFQIGFEWTKDFIRWFKVENRKEVDIRKVNVKISTPMNLFINHWYGDNSTAGIDFLGKHSGGGGQALYDKVEVYQ
jgi:endo-1,3-1,4-beta-glycanase ExoK